ncbi:hypothetical protein ACMHYJ_02015 [Castellaniella hirudinis]|uniref:hypothetical protein n=1 Tax=Castellaniella hirudinis TaxID=1144617 RepID=UPI0039C0CB86
MEFIYYLAIMVASYLISTALAPKPKAPPPAAFEDFDFPQYDETTPQLVVFGDVWLKDWQVLWYGNYRTSAIKNDGDKKK